jgi:sulfate permease, SulP family
VLDRIPTRHRALIVDLSGVPFLDATAANTLEGLSRKAAKLQVRLVLTGANDEVRSELLVHGVAPPYVEYEGSIDAALEELRKAGVVDAGSNQHATTGAGDPFRPPAPSKD